MANFAKFKNPITGEVTKLPTRMSMDQALAILVLIASKPDKKSTDRIQAMKYYHVLTGEAPKATLDAEGSQVHTLRVVVDQQVIKPPEPTS